MKIKFYIAFAVFAITFCTPALIGKCLETYMNFGSKLGETIYEELNENN